MVLTRKRAAEEASCSPAVACVPATPTALRSVKRARLAEPGVSLSASKRAADVAASPPPRVGRTAARLGFRSTKPGVALKEGVQACAAPASPCPGEIARKAHCGSVPSLPTFVEPLPLNLGPSLPDFASVPSTSALTPRPPPASPTSKLLKITASLHRSSLPPSRLQGRDAEREKILSFLKDTLGRDKSGGLYISGCPGTGKSALVDEIVKGIQTPSVCKEWNLKAPSRAVQMNCMTTTDPKHFFDQLAAEILGRENVNPSMDCITVLRKFFEGNDKASARSSEESKLCLVVLDEIDHLLTRDPGVLVRLYTWCTLTSSKLVLIGIANALDMADQMFGNLALHKAMPRHIDFRPYTISELVPAIVSRIPADARDALDEKVIEVCARKTVAAGVGDLRMAMELLERVCEHALQQRLSGNAAAIAKIGIPQAASALASIGPSPAPPSSSSAITPAGSSSASSAPSSATSALLESMSMSLRLVVASVFASDKAKSASSSSTARSKGGRSCAAGGPTTPMPTIEEAWSSYLGLCSRTMIPAITRSEFIESLQMLESQSMLSLMQSAAGLAGPSSKKLATMGGAKVFSMRIQATIRGKEVGDALKLDGILQAANVSW